MRTRPALRSLHAGGLCVASAPGTAAARDTRTISRGVSDVAARTVFRRTGTGRTAATAVSRGVPQQYGRPLRSTVRRTASAANWFDECFYSNEMGFRKPDPEAYLHVSKALDVPPNEITFFDDSVECVNGAIAVGMHGQHVTGFGDLQIRLNQMGILTRRAQHPFWGGDY